jgi:hypothetical protein
MSAHPGPAELKPCPFCGGAAEIQFFKLTQLWGVACRRARDHDAARVYSVTFDPEDAVKAWNRRALAPSDARERVRAVIIDQLYVGDSMTEADQRDVTTFADAVLTALGLAKEEPHHA